jgi:hypothetical protein
MQRSHDIILSGLEGIPYISNVFDAFESVVRKWRSVAIHKD